MQEEKRPNIKGTILGTIFVIWFIGSIVAMFYFGKVQSNGYYVCMIFGQYFLVFGLIALFCKQLIGLPFFLVGLACIFIPFLMLNPNLLPVELNWNGVIILLLIAAFVIAGLCLIIIPLYSKNKRLKTCSVTVPATIVEYNTTYDEGTELYSPIYEYYFNGQKYKSSKNIFSNVGNKRKGSIINIKIDPNNPSVFEDNHMSIIIPIILGIFFLIMSLPIFIMILMNLDKLIK